MKIENDRIVIEPADVAGLSTAVQSALRARNAEPDVVLTRHLNRLIELSLKDFSAVISKNISDIAIALAGDPSKTAEVLPVLNQARTILGLDVKAESPREVVTISSSDVGTLKI